MFDTNNPNIVGYENFMADLRTSLGLKSGSGFVNTTNGKVSVSDKMETGRTYNKVVDFLNSNQLFKSQSFDNVFDIKEAQESQVASSYNDFDQLRTIQDRMLALCEECNIPANQREATISAMAKIFHRATSSKSATMSHWAAVGNRTDGVRPAYEFYGRSPVVTGDFDFENTGAPILPGQEDFGQNIDLILPDVRAALTVVLMKPHRGISDRMFFSESITIPMVRYSIVFDELFDLNKAAQAVGVDRDRWDHRVPMIVLYRKPEQMNFIPIKLVPQQVNDTTPGTVAVPEDGLLAFNMEHNLYDLSLSQTENRTHADHWTRISEGVALEEIHIKISTTMGGAQFDQTVTEEFVINVAGNARHRLLMMEQPIDSGWRDTNMHHPAQFDKAIVTKTGAPSVIFEGIDNPYLVYLMCDVAAKIDLKTSRTHAMMTATAQAACIDQTAAVTQDILDLVADMTIEMIGYKIDARWSEENLRMSSLIVRQNVYGLSYELPTTRTFMVDSSIQETRPENVLDSINNMQTIGCDNRDIQLVKELFERVFVEQTKEEKDPMYRANTNNTTLNMQYAAGSKVNPTILPRTLDLGNANVKNIRSADLFGDLRQYMDSYLTKLFSELHVLSLYSMQLDAGEMPAYKVVTSIPILENLLSVPHIHDHLNRAGVPGTETLYGNVGDTYIRVLPSGVQMHCIPCSFDYMREDILIIPFRPNNPKSEYNFATKYDFGTFAAHYQPQSRQGVANRMIVNVRNFPVPTNPIGIWIRIPDLFKLLPDVTKPLDLSI